MLFGWEWFRKKIKGIYLGQVFIVVLSDKTNVQTSFSSIIALSQPSCFFLLAAKLHHEVTCHELTIHYYYCFWRDRDWSCGCGRRRSTLLKSLTVNPQFWISFHFLNRKCPTKNSNKRKRKRKSISAYQLKKSHCTKLDEFSTWACFSAWIAKTYLNFFSAAL